MIKLKAGQIVEAEDGSKIEVENGDSLKEGSSGMQDLCDILKQQSFAKSVFYYSPESIEFEMINAQVILEINTESDSKAYLL